MPTIAIQGALNVDNFGDVLLGKLFADWVKEAGSDVIAPFSSNATRSQMGVARPGSFSQADALLYIGGGYFGEPDRSFLGKWRWGFRMMRNHLRPAAAFVFSGRPIAIVGVGCGNISNLLARAALVAVARASRKVIVRDLESQSFMRRIGAGSKVEVTADAVLSLANHPVSPASLAAAERLQSQAEGRPIVVLHLDQQSASPTQWKGLVDHLVLWCNANPYYVVFATDQRNTPPSDRQVAAYRDLVQRVPKSAIHEYGGIDDLIGVLSTASLVITTKLHVGIVSATQGTPVFSFATHPKTIRLYRQLGIPERCLHVSTWDEQSIRKVLADAASTVGTRFAIPESVVALATKAKTEVKSFVQEILSKDASRALPKRMEESS